MFRNLNDLDFDLSGWLKVKCDGVNYLQMRFPIDMYSNYMSISQYLALIVSHIFSYSLSLGPNCVILQMHKMTPKMTLNVTRLMLHHIVCTTGTRESQISLWFGLWSLVFQIIELFCFSVRYNGEFEIFKNTSKTSLKITNSNFHKIRNIVRTIGRKNKAKFENFCRRFSPRFVGEVAFWNCSHWIPC